MVKQNLIFCLLFSSLGGLCKILATVVLIIPDDREKSGVPVAIFTKIGAVTLNLILQAMTSAFFTLAPMFGPVSLYTPTSISSILLCNMFILWVVLRREAFTKDMRVATYVCVLAVIVLPVVGPAVQDDQDVGALLFRPLAMIWSIFLVAVFTASTTYMLTKDLRNVQDPIVAEVCLFAVGVFSSTLMPTIARAMMIVDGIPQYVLISIYIFVQPILGYEAMLESVAVPSRGRFVPMCSAGTVLLNAITGIILWGDWDVTKSHVAYICTLLLIFEGVYLISDYDFFAGHIAQKREKKRKLIGQTKEDTGFLLSDSSYGSLADTIEMNNGAI